jgi:hypothetical protein
MAVYKMYPVIEVGILEDEIKTRFNIDVQDELRNILFYEDYMNDCYKSYYFADDEEYTGKSWQNEEHIRIRNLVNAYLRDILPGHEKVLIDVSW